MLFLYRRIADYLAVLPVSETSPWEKTCFPWLPCKNCKPSLNSKCDVPFTDCNLVIGLIRKCPNLLSLDRILKQRRWSVTFFRYYQKINVSWTQQGQFKPYLFQSISVAITSYLYNILWFPSSHDNDNFDIQSDLTWILEFSIFSRGQRSPFSYKQSFNMSPFICVTLHSTCGTELLHCLIRDHLLFDRS